MKELFFKKKIYFFVIAFIIMLAVGFFYFIDSKNAAMVRAGTGDNVTGYAWSENIGWVSFNCTNDNSCTGVNYGVNISKSTGALSGYAWNDSIGWISFNRKTCASGTDTGKNCQSDSDCAGGAPCSASGSGATGSPPGEPFLTDETKIAVYNSETGNIRGWAKILSMGADGWIFFGDLYEGEFTFTLTFPLPFPAALSGGSYGVSMATSTGEWSGWAWNGNDDGSGIGWLSFNCLDTANCATSDYKVISQMNAKPTAKNLTAPNWTFENACQLYAKQAILRWQFNDTDEGSSQSAYQVIINDVDDINNPLFDSGKATTSAAQFAAGPTILDYNKTYYWWVRVWDNENLASDYAAGPSFTTYKHEFPDVDFTHVPLSPSKGEEVQFSSNPVVYGGSSISEILWTAENATITNSTSTSPTMVFNATGNSKVDLKVTDSDGYYCNKEKTININVTLPSWHEVKPR